MVGDNILSLWAKSRAVIDKDNLLILDMDNEIASAVLIANLASNRREVLSIAKKNGARIDMGMGSITTWYFNNFYMAM